MRRRLTFAVAAVALILAWLAVRFLSFRWLAPSVAGLGALPPHPVDAEPRAVTVGRVICHVAERLPWHSTCLVRALAARLVLTRLGIPSVLCIGVTKENGAVLAHAWLLAGGGIVCGGGEAPGYVPIATATSTRRTA